ncbi:hypothetical protein AAW14_06050 [Streptomyces hygroscopicus]|uniref:hypothetical protein n=1 Tax=Streptomyces hygroscopicus TaxID=1912 RepID=UPI00223ED7C0|nr:hypothetical protein [Streptomyces hygroscopicus]MCW7941608.1 hypothetical protein [Streptomyces hygroscopicus]
MTAPTPPRPVDTLESRIAASLQLEADVRAIVARQRACQTLADAAAHTHSPSDRLAYALDAWLVAHPDAPVSTLADYPAWAAAMAATNPTPKETP